MKSLKITFLFFLVMEITNAGKLRYKEEFYRLYYLPQYSSQTDYNRNIYWLQMAMKIQFAPPIQALTICKTKKQYEKYRLLLKMHLNYLMAKNHVYIAARYDKHEPVWFNQPYKEDILKSLDIAEYHYQCAENYWNEMLKYKEAAEIIKKTRIELDFLEDMIHKVNVEDVNYKRVVDRKLNKLKKTRLFFNSME